MSKAIDNYLKAYSDTSKHKVYYVSNMSGSKKTYYKFRSYNGVFSTSKHNNMLKLFRTLESSGNMIVRFHRASPVNTNVILNSHVSIEFEEPISLIDMSNIFGEIREYASPEHMLEQGKRWGFLVKDDIDVQLD